MIIFTKRVNKYLKRCPKCGDSKIYKRKRYASKNITGRYDADYKKEHLYVCRRCKDEFDTPLIISKMEADKEDKEDKIITENSHIIK